MTNKDGISVDVVRALLEGTTPGPWARADWSCDDGPNRFTIEASEPEVLRPGQSSIWPDGIRKMRVAEVEEGENPEKDGDLIAAAPSIARAYLALSERVGELEGLLTQARPYLNEVGHGSAFTEKGKAEALEIRDAIFAALSHKGMDHG